MRRIALAFAATLLCAATPALAQALDITAMDELRREVEPLCARYSGIRGGPDMVRDELIRRGYTLEQRYFATALCLSYSRGRNDEALGR